MHIKGATVYLASRAARVMRGALRIRAQRARQRVAARVRARLPARSYRTPNVPLETQRVFEPRAAVALLGALDDAVATRLQRRLFVSTNIRASLLCFTRCLHFITRACCCKTRTENRRIRRSKMVKNSETKFFLSFESIGSILVLLPRCPAQEPRRP